MSELFQRERSVITRHINNVFSEGELGEKSNVQILHISHSDRPVKFYSLDVIISVGYRVKSLRGTQFRQWATTRLREYIIKGFTINDDLLKQAGGGNYFDELLARICDIRSSEKVFWRKVLDIYATSVDYNPKDDMSLLFFKTVQNKMHWAVHGQTAAEVIHKHWKKRMANMKNTIRNMRMSCQKPSMILSNTLKRQPSKLKKRMKQNKSLAERSLSLSYQLHTPKLKP